MRQQFRLPMNGTRDSRPAAAPNEIAASSVSERASQCAPGAGRESRAPFIGPMLLGLRVLIVFTSAARLCLE